MSINSFEVEMPDGSTVSTPSRDELAALIAKLELLDDDVLHVEPGTPAQWSATWSATVQLVNDARGFRIWLCA